LQLKKDLSITQKTPNGLLMKCATQQMLNKWTQPGQ